MNWRRAFKQSTWCLLLLVSIVTGSSTLAANIDSTNKFAWGENVGWLDFAPSSGPGVTVTDTALEGDAWAENIGWIKLDPANGGVHNNGAGNLSGYAWGENVGWINFAPTGGGVKINTSTGAFSGYAWGENIGWINFAPTNGGVTTSWRPAPASLTLAPATAANPVGTQHCVTATVKDAAGNPTPGITVRFSVTGSVVTTGSATTNSNGEATVCYTGPQLVGADAITAYADTNTNNVQDSGEPGGAAAKTWVPAAPATLMLAPGAASNTVNTQHCVTATVKDAFTNPTPGITVRFNVTGSVTTSGSGTTNASGQATFCYTGPQLVGADAITAYADTNNNNTQNPGEPGGAAAKTWVPGAPATLTLAPAADSNVVGTQHCVTATVKDAFGNPIPGITVRFNITGSVNSTGSGTTNASGQATFCYIGPQLVGADAITAYADTNNNNTQNTGEPSGAAAKTWIAGAPATLIVTPATAANTVGAQHCVTATVRDIFGNPTPGITVRFTVSGSVNTTGSATTNAGGQASFCYIGPALPGADAITAYADTNNNNTQNAGEPSGAATKAWILPITTAGCDITGGGQITVNNGDKATFGGNAKSAGPKGNEEYTDQGPTTPLKVKAINVQAVVCSTDRTQASIYGQATVNGSTTVDYLIQEKDLGESGRQDTYRITLSNGYDSGEHTLEGGNIQIH